jgi:cysteine desulfurase family protein (TIGR01976 family)
MSLLERPLHSTASGDLAARVRGDFPVFERRIRDLPIAFFDGPGGSQVPSVVAAAVAEYLTHHNANTHGDFVTSQETDLAISAARAAMADLLGGRSSEIVFGQNMTTLTFALSRGLGAEWGPGDGVVITELDHQANQAPWRRMAEDREMTVRTIPFDPRELRLDYAALESAIGPRTRLVAVGGASNAVGTINDVRRVTEAARAAGALSFVDAVHLAPHHRIDVEALGCDFLACSAYKFFGPHVGILWGRGELLERFTPYKVPPASDLAPERWETGTLNHEGIAGTRAAVDWMASLGGVNQPRPAALDVAFARIHAHEMALFDQLADGLRSIPGVQLYGPEPGMPRTPTAAFTVDGVSAGEVARGLAALGVFVWSGHFYASSITARLGLDERGGLVRAGIAPYTTTDDVARLLDGVRRLPGG